MSMTYRSYGHGPKIVIIVHDWLGDHHTWDLAKPYLDTKEFTYHFVSLRGYGESKNKQGEYTLEEIQTDFSELMNEQKWDKFSLVGHSMGGLVVQALAQNHRDRVSGVVAVTPVSPTGMQVPDEVRDHMKQLALADDSSKQEMLSQMWGDRLSKTWVAFKAKQWLDTADQKAAAAYVDMFTLNDISDKIKDPTIPMRVIGAEQDAEVFNKSFLTKSFTDVYKDCKVETLIESSHYPMQECPPLFVSKLETFLKDFS